MQTTTCGSTRRWRYRWPTGLTPRARRVRQDGRPVGVQVRPGRPCATVRPPCSTRADVVFTGGPSLYRATKDRHPNCHCFSSSVDAAHFGKRRSAHLPEPPEPGRRAPPPARVLRGDRRAVRRAAAGRGRGRATGVAVRHGRAGGEDRPGRVCRRAAEHPLRRAAAVRGRCPNFLAGWDVALLPFARNDSTKIDQPDEDCWNTWRPGSRWSAPASPTSSSPYGAMPSAWGTRPDEFVAACDTGTSTRPRRSALRRAEPVTAAYSPAPRGTRPWRSMAELIEQGGSAQVQGSPARPRRSWWSGPARPGLSAAYHLGERRLCWSRRTTRVGGWCRSLTDGGFTFDYAGHIMFSNDPYVHDMYKTAARATTSTGRTARRGSTRKDVYTRYPFQGSLYGLPANGHQGVHRRRGRGAVREHWRRSRRTRRRC